MISPGKTPEAFRVSGKPAPAVLIACCCLMLFVQAVYPQSTYTPTISDPLSETWRWRPLEMLSAKGVRCMVDDTQGNMWFGLDRGILKYDGYEWELFDQEDFLQQPVGILFKTNTGDIFAGSESGLLRYHNHNWEKLFPAVDSLQTAITCIEQLSDGTLMAGIQEGILLLKDDKVTIMSVNSRIPQFKQRFPEAELYILPDEILFQRNVGRVDEIYADQDGLIWLFMSRNNAGKLLRFRLNDFQHQVLHHFDLESSLGGHELANRVQMLQTTDGSTWLINGFYKSGILKKDRKSWQLLKLSDLFGGDELHTSIIELSDGSVLIGGLGKLFVYKNRQWHVFAAPALPIPSSRIVLHESDDGHLWIAGMQGDVFRVSYRSGKWIKYKGLNHQFTDDHDREWFLSSDGQVVSHDRDEWLAYDSSHGLIDAPVRLVCTRGGRIWVAGSHQGVAATAFLDNHRWIKQLHPALSWGIDPRSVFQDQSGSLWFGASVDRQDGQISGVLKLANPDAQALEWDHHSQQQGIGQHNVYGIGQSADGALWLGGTNLLRYDGNRWQTLPRMEHFNEFVDIVYSRKHLWVGSRYYGLFRYDGNDWTHFTTHNGLPSNTIISIFEENDQSAWVVTDKDIARFDGSKWYSGIFSNDFKIPREGGEITVDRNETIWINKSLREWKRRAFPFSITPDEAFQDFWTVRYVREKNPPKTNIHIYPELVDQSGNTLIGWQGSDFWEDTPAASLSYSYRINQDEWSEFSQETSVVLTNLKDGKHTFEVRARDLDMNIEKEPTRIEFSVRPPIWKQGWFIALVISFLSIIGFYEAKLIKRNKKLSRLNTSLKEANETLESRQEQIERQTKKILQQKEELEKKTLILEEKNKEIIHQRDQLSDMVDKVEELSRVKTRFFTNISHEFRTPLTLILGSIERLLSSQEHNKNTINRTYEIIGRNSKRILHLINQILEVRKIETGKLRLHPSRGDIVSFTAEIAKLFSDLADKQSVKLSFHTNRSSLKILFDHDKIEKILFNLLSNAFKSTPPGGSISISLSGQHATEFNEQKNTISQDARTVTERTIIDHLEIKVRDSGQGIPGNCIERIFDRFYQVDEFSSYHKFDSSGIGLSYVKDLVEIHNGVIRVESEQGKGCEFTLQIPCVFGEDSVQDEADAPATATMISDDIRQEIENMGRELHQNRIIEENKTKQLEQALLQGDKLQIMIVEDEHDLRQFIRDILEPDYEILEAANGKDGYDHAVAVQPDLVITDVMMPIMNGHELCRELKNNLATSHIPIIMLTAQVAPENKLKGYKKGADAYIEKPFDREFLTIRINNLLEAKQKTREKALRDLISQPNDIVVHSDEDKMLRKIQQILEENISDSGFDVESMSQQFHLSRFHFSRKIKQITGLTPKEIIDSFRLKRAGQLLQQQKLSVSEVAYMVGFEHPNSFTRAFRKYYHMTPSEFSNQN